MISGYGIRGKATDAGFTDYNHLRIVNICEPRISHNRKNRHCKKARKNDPNLFDPFLQELIKTQQENPSKTEALIASKSRKFLSGFLVSPWPPGCVPNSGIYLRHMLTTPGRSNPLKRI